MDIWIKNIDVVTVNEEFEVLRNSNIYIRENKIYHLGSKLEDFSPDKIIDGKNQVAMPGLINAHTHIGMSIFRNYGNDVSLESWLNDYIWPIESKLEPEDIYYGSSLSLAEMIETGTTSFVDMYFSMDKVAQAVEESGMRALLGRGLAGHSDEDLALEEEFYKKWNEGAGGRINTIISPHAVYTNSKEDLIREINLAKKLKTGMHIHLNESETEVKNSIAENGMSPLKYVDSLGLLDERTIAAHCVWLSDKEVEIAKERKITMVHNPSSNMKLASGFQQTQRLLDENINVALGTDGSASNNTLDMFEEMKLASLIAKGYTLDPSALDARTVIEMATVNGARALGKKDCLGRIKEGYLADIILVDFDNIHHSPNNDIVASLVYSTKGSDVVTSIIDGQVVMEDRQIKNLDVKDLRKRVSEIFNRLKD